MTVDAVTSDSLDIVETGPMPCMACRRRVWFIEGRIVEKVGKFHSIEHRCPVPKPSESRSAA
jgi:hypothetical protein